MGPIGKVSKSLRSSIDVLDAKEALASWLHGQQQTVARDTLKKELQIWMRRKEVAWRQRLRAVWLKVGDCNSKFFHKVANGRR